MTYEVDNQYLRPGLNPYQRVMIRPTHSGQFSSHLIGTKKVPLCHLKGPCFFDASIPFLSLLGILFAPATACASRHSQPQKPQHAPALPCAGCRKASASCLPCLPAPALCGRAAPLGGGHRAGGRVPPPKNFPVPRPILAENLRQNPRFIHRHISFAFASSFPLLIQCTKLNHFCTFFARFCTILVRKSFIFA